MPLPRRATPAAEEVGGPLGMHREYLSAFRISAAPSPVQYVESELMDAG